MEKYTIFKVIFLFLFAMFSFHGNGQSVQKKTLTEKDYHLWGTLRNDKVSPNGNWASFVMHYDSGQDTLFVQSTKTSKRYFFVKGYDANFGSDNWFACKTPDDTLSVINLATGSTQQFPKSTQYHFSGNEKFIACFSRTGDNGYLILRNMKGQEVMKINEVVAWKVSPCANFIACVTPKEVIVLKLGKTIEHRTVINSSQGFFYAPEWNQNSTGLTFLSKSGTSGNDLLQEKKFYYYRLWDKRLFSLSSGTVAGTTDHWEFTLQKPAVSSDGKNIFIPMEIPSTQLKSDDTVKIWNTQDHYVRTSAVRSSKRPQKRGVFLWQPEISKIVPITEKINTEVLLNTDTQKVLLSEPVVPLQYTTLEPNKNYYIKDMADGSESIVLKDFPGYNRSVTVSATGRFFTYFRDRNWWVFDCIKNLHQMISKDIQQPLGGDIGSGDIKEYGIAGWTLKDRYLLVYDKFDIYKVAMDGSSSQRITKGREKGIVYRIVQHPKKWQQAYLGNEEVFDLDRGFIILGKELDQQRSGYYIWSSKGLKEIISGEYKYDALQQSADAKTITVIEQDVSTPPRLIIIQQNGQRRKLFQSNEHFKNFKENRSVRIRYKGSEGQSMSGVLYYPTGYDSQKKYPMIVHIYEIQTSMLHQYWLPTLFNPTGFNVANLTAKGYFVLFPDIEIKIGKPGESALKCVLAALDSALLKANIDKDRIGLIGHSFGGYESAYIATHTNRFATVVSGAGFMDLTNFYLSISANHKVPEYWRSENAQQRMLLTPFDDWALYDRNSPIRAAMELNTPILTYTGEDDTQVNPLQSLEFWLALKRLGKQNIMLVYPDENHVFENPKSQTDLTRKIEQWFGYYLKGDAYPKWAEPYRSN